MNEKERGRQEEAEESSEIRTEPVEGFSTIKMLP